ncbi:MAG: hypothetical protein D6807_09490 [Alphaproteobacteria bacterium]|nr:MAG: hypothetical protein D6807_09490 [Alphaproteobacteria bacterium]
MLEKPIRRASGDGATPLVGILSNCASTQNRRRLAAVRRLVAREPHVFHFQFEDIRSIPEGLRLFADARVGLIVINGGDGTIQATLSSIINDNPFRTVPPLAILPGGRTNMIAADLGARGRPERVLRKLFRIVARGRLDRHLTERAIITLDVGDGAPPRAGLFFGTGGVVNGIEWCRRRIHPLRIPSALGHAISIAWLVLSALVGVRSSPLRADPQTIVPDDGRRLHGRFAVVVATTLDCLLLGLRPFGEDGTGGIKFSAIAFGRGPLWRAVIALALGRFSRGGMDGCHVGRADHIRIEGPVPVTLDGEIYRPCKGRPVVLHCPGNLSFVRL